MTIFSDNVSNYQTVEGLLAADFAGVKCELKNLNEKEMRTKKPKDASGNLTIIPHLETPEGGILTESGAIATHLMTLGGDKAK